MEMFYGNMIIMNDLGAPYYKNSISWEPVFSYMILFRRQYE